MVDLSNFESIRANLSFTMAEVIAIANVLRLVEDEDLADAGMLPAMIDKLAPIYDSLDNFIAEKAGEDWLLFAQTEESLEEEASQDAYLFGDDEGPWTEPA